MKSSRRQILTENAADMVNNVERKTLNTASILTIADDSSAPASTSPARVLQDELSMRLSSTSPDKKWSQRRTLAFIVVVCGGFWVLAGLGLEAMLRR